MKTRLAWCGPWNTRSAIATFGRLVVSELLARNHEVTVFRTEMGGALNEPLLPISVRVENLHTIDGRTPAVPSMASSPILEITICSMAQSSTHLSIARAW